MNDWHKKSYFLFHCSLFRSLGFLATQETSSDTAQSGKRQSADLKLEKLEERAKKNAEAVKLQKLRLEVLSRSKTAGSAKGKKPDFVSVRL